MVELPPDLCARVMSLKRDSRGLPIPWFAPIVDGAPNFSGVKPERLDEAHRRGICWICGQPLGSYRAFVVGPMAAINRISKDSAMHADCARDSVRICPYLANPRLKRTVPPLPHTPVELAVEHLQIVAVYITRVAKRGASNGTYHLGAPTSIEWWREGIRATAKQVLVEVSAAGGRLWAEAKKRGATTEFVARDRIRALFDQLPPLTAEERADLHRLVTPEVAPAVIPEVTPGVTVGVTDVQEPAS